jgi:hypothetical protein
MSAGERGAEIVPRPPAQQAHAGVVADRKEGDLTARNAELLRLLAELAREAQQRRPQLIRDGEGIGNNVVNH